MSGHRWRCCGELPCDRVVPQGVYIARWSARAGIVWPGVCAPVKWRTLLVGRLDVCPDGCPADCAVCRLQGDRRAQQPEGPRDCQLEVPWWRRPPRSARPIARFHPSLHSVCVLVCRDCDVETVARCAVPRLAHLNGFGYRRTRRSNRSTMRSPSATTRLATCGDAPSTPGNPSPPITSPHLAARARHESIGDSYVMRPPLTPWHPYLSHSPWLAHPFLGTRHSPPPSCHRSRHASCAA